MIKNVFVEYFHNLLNTATEIHTNLPFLNLYVFYCSYFFFFTFAKGKLQYLLENNQLLYSLHCSLLTPYVLISIRYILKTSHCHSVLDL